MHVGQPSHTADRVAARRAAHQWLDDPLVLVDPVAIRLLSADAAQRLRDDPRAFERSAFSRYLRAFVVARSRYAEDLVAAAVARGVNQYLVVGAGFDTFAYRNPFPGLHVIEIDHPATQAEKRWRLAAAGLADAPGVTYIAADLATSSLADALANSSFDRQRPAVVSWLGVVPYLEHSAIRAVLETVATYAPGSEIVFDYGVPPESLGIVGRMAMRLVAARVALAGEPFKSYFTPEAMDALLREAGLAPVEDLGGAAINARYFSHRSDSLSVPQSGRFVRAQVREGRLRL